MVFVSSSLRELGRVIDRVVGELQRRANQVRKKHNVNEKVLVTDGVVGRNRKNGIEESWGGIEY